jgi:signal transduction histidine kinase
LAAEEKRVRVEVEIDPELAIATDGVMARLVINNLLDNAVSYANEGGYVRVEGRGDECGRVELCVSNSGSVLNDAQARRAFDRFWRGDGARRNTGVHCGLGLSLCRELMELLSGEITATSEVGGAFLVRIVFPAAAGHELLRSERTEIVRTGAAVKGALQ